MPLLEAVIEVEGQPYVICFTSNAMFRLEQVLGQHIQVIAQRLLGGDAGLKELQTLLWAGLEGARLRQRQPRAPWTMDEVGDLIDRGGGLGGFWPRWAETLGRAIGSALPVAEPGATGRPPQAASTGMASSTAPPGSASPSPTSGT